MPTGISYVEQSPHRLRPSRRADVATHRLDNEALLYGQRNGSAHHLNQTALAVWERCDGRNTVVQIAQAQARHYGIKFDEALDDVEQLITMFAETELVDVAEEP